MAKLDVWYTHAKQLYVMQKKNLKEISEITGVSTTTLSKWKSLEEKGWEEQRRDYLVKGSGGVAKLEDTIHKMLEDINEFSSKDDIKTLKELKSLYAELKEEIDIFQATIMVMEKLVIFLKKYHPDTINDFLAILAEFQTWLKE